MYVPFRDLHLQYCFFVNLSVSTAARVFVYASVSMFACVLSRYIVTLHDVCVSVCAFCLHTE